MDVLTSSLCPHLHLRWGTAGESDDNKAMQRDGSEAGEVTVAPGVKLPRAALSLSFSRAGGPGGQHVNKASTRVTLSVELTALAAAMPSDAFERLKQQAGRYMAGDRLQISSGQSRSQVANRRTCHARLRQLIVEASHRPRPRKATRPSRAAMARRIENKRMRSQRKAERRANRRGES